MSLKTKQSNRTKLFNNIRIYKTVKVLQIDDNMSFIFFNNNRNFIHSINIFLTTSFSLHTIYDFRKLSCSESKFLGEIGEIAKDFITKN